MATAHPGTLLRHLHTLADGRARQRTNRQLLDDFADRRDEAAFAMLVARHGPMVLRVCRRVLQHEQDAEDAFQATFLVLARNSRAVRKPEALAAWLHGVAFRTAMKAKRGAARRRTHEAHLRSLSPKSAASPSWDDVQAVLDEEIQRLPEAFRMAFVLCVLEGKSVPEAAVCLEVKPGTVSSRLTRARQRLQRQLARRGIQLTSLLAALSVAEGFGRASVPAVLAHTTIRLVLSVEVIPSHIAALAAGVTRAMFLTKIKIATAMLFAVGLLIAGASELTRQVLATPHEQALAETKRPAKAKPPTTRAEDEIVKVQGRVVDPDGKPFAGTKLYLRYYRPKEEDYSVRATSGADGRFAFTFKRSVLTQSTPDISWFQVIAVAQGFGPDWAYRNKPEARTEMTLRLVEDVPIRGRVVDLQGKPVKGATLRVEHIDSYADTEAFLQTVRDRAWPRVESKGWDGPFPGQPRTLTTDADGRFRLTGVGRDRLVQFQLEGPGIQYGPVRALARAMKAPAEPRPLKFPAGGPNIVKIYGATFDHAAPPSRLIRGVVRDKKTGRPIEGIEISAFGTTHRTHSDKEGRYELLGCPKSSEGCRVSFWPAGQLYFATSVTFPDTQGLDPIQGDMELVSGILAKGRVTHQHTGEPIAGATVHYNPLYPNIFVRVFGPNGAGTIPCSWVVTGPDGSYSLVVLPGPGALGFNARSPKETFMPALVTARQLKDLFKDEADHGNEDRLKIQAGVTSYSYISPGSYNHLLLINPDEKDKSLTQDVGLRPVRPVRGNVIGPDGKRLTGITAYNLAPGVISQSLEDDTFKVEGLHPQRARHLVFLDKDRKYGAFVTLQGEVKETLTIRLEACSSVVGRILDRDGEPLAGATVRLDDEILPASVPPHVKTDRQGRFRIDGLVPGQQYQPRLGLPPFGQYLFAPLALKAGESRDLGNWKLKPKD